MVKIPPINAGDTTDLGSVLGSGRPPGGGHGNPLQHSCLGNYSPPVELNVTLFGDRVFTDAILR